MSSTGLPSSRPALPNLQQCSLRPLVFRPTVAISFASADCATRGAGAATSSCPCWGGGKPPAPPHQPGSWWRAVHIPHFCFPPVTNETSLKPHTQLNMCKIAVKTLIESTIGVTPPIKESHRPLSQVSDGPCLKYVSWRLPCEPPTLTHSPSTQHASHLAAAAAGARPAPWGAGAPCSWAEADALCYF